MSTQPRIVMKNTTKVTLNERFTAYREQAERALSSVHATVQQQVSLRNLRFAQQMANKPSVVAALKLKKRSLKQRLGPTSGMALGTTPLGVKSRLGPVTLIRSPLHSRLGPLTGPSYTSVGARCTRPGTSPILRSRLGFKATPPARMVTGALGRRGFGVGRHLYWPSRGAGVGTSNSKGVSKGSLDSASSRHKRGAGRRHGARKGGGKHMLNRDELDSQLDAYMAKTKNHLDAELDAYMAQSDF